MATRGAGIQTASGSAQPVFGTTLTSAFTPTPDPHTGTFGGGSAAGTATFTVTSAAWFRNGDHVSIGPAGGPYEIAKISSISGLTVTVKGTSTTHAVGEFMILGISAARIKIMVVTGALMYLGFDSTVSAVSTSTFDIVPAAAGGLFYDIGISTMGNIYGTTDYWIKGTAADTFLPSLTTV